MITNRSFHRIRRPVAARRSVLYEPGVGEWTYSHHASVCCFKGKFYAMWSNSEINEDEIGQRVLYCTSEDGEHWSAPKILFDSMPGAALTAGGFLVYGESLAAYAGYYAYVHIKEDGMFDRANGEHKNTTLFRMETTDGENWSAPEDLHVPVVPNHGPQPTKSGRLILSGNILFPYTDDPSGKSGWKLTGPPPFPYEPLYDDSYAIEVRAPKYNVEWACEGSFFQTDDGTLHMLQRTRKKKLLLTESRDNGETWSEPEWTDFTDCGTKFHCGRLPDGRFYVVGSPDPASSRCPLVLSISKDGKDFDREWIIDDTFRPRRHDGLWKGGIYGYPHSMIHGDHLYVICSINKEDISVYRVCLQDLED